MPVQGHSRCRANKAHIRQSEPDCGIDFQVKVLKTFQVVPSPLARGGLVATQRVRTGSWTGPPRGKGPQG